MAPAVGRSVRRPVYDLDWLYCYDLPGVLSIALPLFETSLSEGHSIVKLTQSSPRDSTSTVYNI